MKYFCFFILRWIATWVEIGKNILQNGLIGGWFCKCLKISILKIAWSLTANLGEKFANLKGEICQISPRNLPSNSLGWPKTIEKSWQNKWRFAKRNRFYHVQAGLNYHHLCNNLLLFVAICFKTANRRSGEFAIRKTMSRIKNADTHYFQITNSPERGWSAAYRSRRFQASEYIIYWLVRRSEASAPKCAGSYGVRL